MSSHHFVKEGQEPALLIADALSLELAQPLLEWSPLVAVCNEALDAVLLWGIKIDVVLCELAAVDTVKNKLLHQMPVQIISYPEGGNPITEGILFMISVQQWSAYLMTRSSAEIFQHLQGFPQLRITLIDQELKWSFYTHPFEKWLPLGNRIYIHKREEQMITISGLTDKESFLEAKADGMARVSSDQTLWVGEPI